MSTQSKEYLFQIFQISLENFYKVLYYFVKNLNGLSIQDIYKLYFYEFQYLLEVMEEDLKKQNEQNKDISNNNNIPSVNSIMNRVKMPNINTNFRLPNLNIKK